MTKETGIAVTIAVIVALGFMFFGAFLFPSAGSTQSAPEDMQGAENAPVTTSSSGLMIQDTTLGTGDEAVAGKTVTVSYVGALTDGTVFDASANHGGSFTFHLGAGEVIKGWDEGVAGMKVGGTRVLTVPPELGYGAQAVGPIPANSTLIFTVELLKVE